MTPRTPEGVELVPDATDPDFLRHPADRAAAYVAAGLWGSRRIEHLLLQHAGDRVGGARPAITADGRTVTHAELGRLVAATARSLDDSGVTAGSRLVVHLPDGLDALVVSIALLSLGAVPAFALPAHRVTEIVGVARTCRAAVHLIGDLPGLDDAARRRVADEVAAAVPGLRTLPWPSGRVSTLPPAPGPAPSPARPGAGADALAFFQLSGGTTGASKLIPRAHREYAYSFLRSTEVCGFDERTVLLPAIPLTHNFPMSSPGWMGALARGGHVVVPAAADARTVGAAIDAHGVTHVQAVPPLVHAWLDAPDFPRRHLRRILVGGARLAEAVARRVHRELAPLQQVYGMAEGLVCYTPLDADEERIVTTQGRPMSPADEVRVVDGEGRAVPVGAPGELWVRGPYTIPAYYRAGAAAADSFTVGGYYRTGDVVTRTAEGDLAVVGRVKEQINRGGEKIAPAEVESLLLRHPGVSDVCVVGVADPVLGERVEAHVVPRDGWSDALDVRSLRRHLRTASLAAFKIPERFHLVAELPQTAVGKIDRRAADAADRRPGIVASVGHTSVEESVDVVGIGFGPANMAVAAALSELPPDTAPRAVFLDAAAGPDWHTGMLLPDAGLQVAFAKDLVTFRNPRSDLSFLNFLVAEGRIHDFFNRGSSAPLRVEFAAYLRWAASRLRDSVRYAHRVVSVTPVSEDGVVTGYRVRAETPDGPRVLRARDVVLAAGLRPFVPAEFGRHERLLHSSSYLHRIDDIPVDATRAEGPDVVVIGGGQSAAEVALDLRTRHPSARVHLVHARFGLIPADSTPFANRIFDHGTVDRLFHAPASVRARLEETHRNTNYSVVHENTLQALYDAQYADSWAGRRRIVLHDVSQVVSVAASGDEGAPGRPSRLDVTIAHELDGGRTTVSADVVVAATGYRPFDPVPLLGDAARDLIRDADGRLVASRDYRLQWRVPTRARLFALGMTAHQHGMAATLLSDIALRAGEVVDALLTVPETTDAADAVAVRAEAVRA